MKSIDTRGLPCPKPTVMVKNEIDVGEVEIEVLVDNDTAKENVSKLAKSMGYSIEVSDIPEGFKIKLNKESGSSRCEVIRSGALYLIKTAVLGQGDDQLGAVLMKSLIYTLTEKKPKPATVVFMNGGVKLTVKGSDQLENLKMLEAGGCEILICGTCLDFFGLKDNVAVGSVSNMYDIIDAVELAESVVSI